MINSDDAIKPRDTRLIRRLIAESKTQPNIGQRIKIISSSLIGYPYIVNPLVGSATEPEMFVTRMDGFDCVTYLETVLALAGSQNVGDFVERLRETRYEGGDVSWRKRLHYTTDWSRYHIKRGFLLDLTRGDETVLRTKTLDFLKGFKPKTARFRYFPKRKLKSVSRRLENGDLIYFVSTRKGLDTFHVGLLVKTDDRILMRHAARSRGGVVEQELSEFVKANRMSGFIVNRPNDSY